MYSYGIVNTFYDDNGEVIYNGIDYDLSGSYNNVGTFSSSCTALRYYSVADEDKAILNYAYTFENKGVNQQGYGEINFTIGKLRSNYHEGRFFNSDGNIYYFRALLITDKKLLEKLSNGSNRSFRSAMEELINMYNMDCNSNQVDIIKNVYELNPHTFNNFCSKEDYAGNLIKEISAFDFNDKTVLDMGAGTGRFTKMVANAAKHVTCSDCSPKMIEYLKESLQDKGYYNKLSFIQCDHLALPALSKEKYDYIIAGYSIGAYFTDKLLTPEQKINLFKEIIRALKSMLNSNGKIIIIESLGIAENGRTSQLFEFDHGLKLYYDLLKKYGFNIKEINTAFRFNTEDEAKKVIWSFWGAEGISKIENHYGKWYVNEMSGIWTISCDELNKKIVRDL